MMFRRRKISQAAVGSETQSDLASQTDIAEIRESGLFDPEWYLATYKDVADVGVDPLVHYVATGAREGRLPGPRFDTLWYLGECPEAGASDLNPILHYLRKGRAMGRTPIALDEAQAFESFLEASRSGQLPMAGKLRSKTDHVHFALNPPRQTVSGDGLPLPPVELSARIGSPTLDGFEEIGRGVKRTLVRCLPAHFDFTRTRCLDFGCGIGRVIRHFAEEARSAEFWGCDVDGTSIRWAVENMTPPFRFYQMAQQPSLPFEDSSFDLIYAVGVFSQVFEGWHQWAVELRRVLKPGGHFFMSYAGQTPFEEMLSLSYESFDLNRGLYVKHPFNSWNRGGPMVFMSPAWVERHWGSIFDIEFVAPDALLDYQSICLMRKPEPGSPPRMGARFVDIATRQTFNPDAFGAIWGAHDETRGLLESYGIEASGPTQVGGWIALRSDRPEILAIAVDEVCLDSTTEWQVGHPYRDWPKTLQTVFHTQFDVGVISHGKHRLAVKVQGEGGITHTMSIPLFVS